MKRIKGGTLYRINYSKSQENEGKFWFHHIIPYFLTPVTSIKIYSIEDLSDGAVIISFKGEKKKFKVKVSSRAEKRVGRSWAQDNRNKTSANNELNS